MKCKGCGKEPKDIGEYASMEDVTPDEFVRNEEGTYNRETDLFWCTTCYIKVGMPLGRA